jgi:uncharacterized protein
VDEAYRERRDELEKGADEIHALLQRNADLVVPAENSAAEIAARASQAVVRRADAERGGFGGAPKFPQPMLLEFLLRRWARAADAEALRTVRRTLDAMAAGGLYDHLGGGFHRYSVDAHWLVPHFEKMLYDNALLGRAYLHAWQATGEPAYRAVVEDVLEWVAREMTHPEGGFFASLDADSEGEEGRFYVWTEEEVARVLDAEDARIALLRFGITPSGNFELGNVLHLARGVDAVAREVERPREEVLAALGRIREGLWTAREERVRPGRDEKVLAAWNGMMLRTVAEAAFALRAPRWRDLALRNAGFLLERLRVDGRWMRAWTAGEARIPGFLEDHAHLALAFLALYRATGEVRWVREARSLGEEILQRFWSARDAVLHDAAEDGDPLVVRPRDLFDNATPSGTSAGVEALAELAALTGDDRFREAAERASRAVAGLAEQMPMGFGNLLSVIDDLSASPREVAVVGREGADATESLLRTLGEHFLPGVPVASTGPERVEEDSAEVPLLAGRALPHGTEAAAFVCERYTCRRPVATPRELAAELDSGAEPLPAPGGGTGG